MKSEDPAPIEVVSIPQYPDQCQTMGATPEYISINSKGLNIVSYQLPASQGNDLNRKLGSFLNVAKLEIGNASARAPPPPPPPPIVVIGGGGACNYYLV